MAYTNVYFFPNIDGEFMVAHGVLQKLFDAMPKLDNVVLFYYAMAVIEEFSYNGKIFSTTASLYDTSLPYIVILRKPFVLDVSYRSEITSFYFFFADLPLLWFVH